QVNTSGHIIGLLYGINTLGAGLGALVGGYVLIGRLGFEGSLWIAVALNVLVGIGAVALFESKKQTRLEERTESHSEATSSLPYRTILVAAFLVGFINLGFEMLWFRVLG